METEKHKKRKNHNKKSKNTNAEDLFDDKFLKQAEKQDPKVFHEFCQLVLKEGISNIVSAVKGGQKPPKLQNDTLTSPLPSNDHSFVGSMRPLKLPKLQSIEENSVKRADLSTPTMFTPQKSLNSMIQSRSSPVLLPIQMLQNFVSKAGFKSRVGIIQGKPKLRNEDCVIIKANLQNARGQYLFAICDGHGIEGHAVTEFVKENYVSNIEMLFPTDSRPEKIHKALTLSCENLSTSLANSKIDTVFSGCTLVTLIISGSNLICANLGNCKAILGNERNKWQMIPLTIEHTLENKKELERMLEKNARIEVEIDKSYIKPVQIQRAYMGSQDVPGLDITRSLGDKCGKYIGMLSTPEVFSYHLSAEDRFIIIGSSGFWKFVTEIDAYMIVRRGWEKNQIEYSCEELINYANLRWREECRDKDDVSVVVVHLGAVN